MTESFPSPLGELHTLGSEGVETVISEFANHRFDADIEGQPLAEADEADRILNAHEATPSGVTVVDMAAVHHDVYGRYERAQVESRRNLVRVAN